MGAKHSRQTRTPTFSDEAIAQSRLTDARKETPTYLGCKRRDIVLSKEVIDFNLGEEPCPLNEIVRDQFTITNNSGKKIKFRFDPIPSASCKLTFEPASGTIDGGKKNVKKIGVKMVLLISESLNFRVNLRIGGEEETLFLLVRTHSEQGVFGVDPTTLEVAQDYGYQVPLVLKSMREALFAQDALSQEGIFRLAGDQNDMKQIKGDTNRTKRFDASDADINTIANLIKVWFRELPVPILNALPTEVLYNSGDPNVCIDAYGSLPEPQKSLLGWLLYLMADVASLRSQNKMSEQNLAIVVAPNLYDPPSSDPMEGLVMSQKAVQFFHNLILNEMELRQNEEQLAE